jgi:hypothetical protein
MSLRFLPEFAEPAKIALALAEREAKHLRYTARTLFAERIDQDWVQRLADREDLAEKIDAFVARFGRLQDHLGEKLLPAFARLQGGQPKSLLDVLAYAERAGWVASAEEFIGARKLRNLLVHEYMTEIELFLDALLSAQTATRMLLDVLDRVSQEAHELGLLP